MGIRVGGKEGSPLHAWIREEKEKNKRRGYGIIKKEEQWPTKDIERRLE